jgi:hypothetical protein
MEFASCHTSGTETFEMDPTFLDNLCILAQYCTTGVLYSTPPPLLTTFRTLTGVEARHMKKLTYEPISGT